MGGQTLKVTIQIYMGSDACGNTRAAAAGNDNAAEHVDLNDMRLDEQ